MNPERAEFQIDRQAFLRAARERLLIRTVLATALVCGLAWLAQTYLDAERSTFIWTGALTLLVVYAAVEASALRWAKISAPVMVVRLTPKNLECWIGANCHRMPWAALAPPRIKHRNGQVSRIDVRDTAGQGVRLAGFEDMEALATAIVEHLVAR